MSTVTCDPRCYELAVHFLSDHPHLDTALGRQMLAEEIQQTIEEFLADTSLDPDHPSNRGFDGPGGAE